MNSWSGVWHADVQETVGLAMAPSQEEKSHTNGAQETTKSVNRWNLCLLTVSRHGQYSVSQNAAVTVR
jgi:hypothetical protein